MGGADAPRGPEGGEPAGGGVGIGRGGSPKGTQRGGSLQGVGLGLGGEGAPRGPEGGGALRGMGLGLGGEEAPRGPRGEPPGRVIRGPAPPLIR